MAKQLSSGPLNISHNNKKMCNTFMEASSTPDRMASTSIPTKGRNYSISKSPIRRCSHDQKLVTGHFSAMLGGPVTIDDTIIRQKGSVDGGTVGNLKRTKSNEDLFEISPGNYNGEKMSGRHETVIRRVSDTDAAEGTDSNTKHKKNKAGSLLNREALNDPNLVRSKQTCVIHWS